MKPCCRIDPAAPLTVEILRIGEAEIDAAIAALHLAHTDPGEGFHECRKSLKKLRALVGLVKSVDRKAFDRLDIAFRDVGRALAGAREATALIETVDRIGRQHEGEAPRLRPVCAALASRRADHAHGSAGGAEMIRLAVRDMGDTRETLRRSLLPAVVGGDAGVLEEGLEHTLRKARKALKHAGKRGDPHDFHELRKAVKAHWMHVALLADIWPGGAKKRLKRLDALGERLGEVNDDFVMLGHLDANPSLAPGEAGDLLRIALRRDVKAGKKRCLARAGKLFDEKPGKLGKRLRRCRLSAG